MIVSVDLFEVVVFGTACRLEVDDDVAADKLYVVGVGGLLFSVFLDGNLVDVVNGLLELFGV